MNKDVMITISSSQLVDGSLQKGAELVTQGTYDYGKAGVRFSYMESELTGMDGTRTIFFVRPDEVVISRKGAVNARMVFHPGESSSCRYSTEYGLMQMGVDTRRMECALDEHGGSMEIEYDLDFERNFMSRNTFKINVRERG